MARWWPINGLPLKLVFFYLFIDHVTCLISLWLDYIWEQLSYGILILVHWTALYHFDSVVYFAPLRQNLSHPLFFYSRRTCTSMQRELKSTHCSLAQWCGIYHVTRPIYHLVNFKAYHVTWLTSARDWIGKEFWPFTCGKSLWCTMYPLNWN